MSNTNHTKWNTYNGREVVNDTTGNVMFEAESPRDANLIAAAPDLLEAAERLVNEPECPDHIAAYFLKAITKAKGDLK